MSTPTTFVILDSGCTRAMGSRFAIDRLVRACQNHTHSHMIKFTKEASHNKFSFANGESSHVKEKLVIHLRNPKHPTGWISTSVDILDKGRVPILFSVEQMRNLRMNIKHTPAGEFLTCTTFGLKLVLPFKDVLRPYFVKGVNHVFLWRFLQLFRCYRGNQEFVLWIGKFEVTSRRVLTAWMDLFHHDTPGAETPQFVALLPAAAQQALQNIEDGDELRVRLQEAHDEFEAHRAQFPLTDNLMSLVFLVQADLNEIQRERFVRSMSLRQVEMNQYTYLQVKQLFMELFCTTRTGIADPTIRHTKRSTFLVHEEGECEGEHGYWVVEEETGEEGFVSLFAERRFLGAWCEGNLHETTCFQQTF